jgi:TnpA family transposase
VDWKAYVFCVLEQFHRMLRRREIFAWEQAKPTVRHQRHRCTEVRAAFPRRPDVSALATYRAANAALIEHQAAIPLAQAWGGGLLASVDGMRFVVPVPSVYARPNPKYSGRRGGTTCLNMINDQAAGPGGKVVAGTPRDSLYVLDVLYDRDGGKRPEVIVTDTAAYSDIVFGLLTLAGFAYAPQLADLPDQKMWRIDRAAGHGPFQDAARGRIGLARIERRWEDVLRITGSIHTGAVRAYDVIRMLSRDGRPTPPGGDAIARYGRIASQSAQYGRQQVGPQRRHRGQVEGVVDVATAPPGREQPGAAQDS